MSEEENGNHEPFGADLVRSLRASRLEIAAAEFNAIINRLWAGCGGGLIFAVTGIRQPTDLFFWLAAGSFALGVILLGVGALGTLLVQTRELRDLEDIDGILQMKAGGAERPSARIGLKIRHPKTFTAVIAAGLFLVGVVSSGVVIYRSNESEIGINNVNGK